MVEFWPLPPPEVFQAEVDHIGSEAMGMANEQHQQMIVVEDHFGSALAVELDRLPHVEAALEEFRTNTAKLDELGQGLSGDLSRRKSSSGPK